MRPVALLAGLAAAALFHVGHASAQPVCGPRAEIVAALADQYKEQAAGRGSAIGRDGIVVFELYVSATGSWTLLMSRPDGVSCIFVAGGNWEPVADERGTY